MPQAADTEQKKPNKDGRLARGEATRDRVLDAAERCFSESGFDAVSIRQIADRAGVTLGVVGFHAGSKNDLFRTVIARRVATLSALRRAALAALQARDGYSLRDLVDAYTAPYLDIASRGDEQWRAYAQLIAKTVSDDRFYPDVRELYDPVATEFLDAIAALHPDADREVLATAFTLMVSSMLSIVASRVRIAGLSGATARQQALEYRRVLVDFCTGGLTSALAAGPL